MNRRDIFMRSARLVGGVHSRLGVVLGLALALGVGPPGTCVAAEPIAVEQAGDHFVNFVLAEIEKTRKTLPAITQAAEEAADRIVGRNGELLSAGDHSFSLEPVWRAGGIAFARQYLPEKQAAAAA